MPDSPEGRHLKKIVRRYVAQVGCSLAQKVLPSLEGYSVAQEGAATSVMVSSVAHLMDKAG
jgi:hypothetical protein